MSFHTHPMTFTLVGINVIIHALIFYILNSLYFNVNLILFKLSLNPEAIIMAHEWWRMFTSMFVHSSLLHLLANMMALLIFSHIMEPILGSKRFLLIYLAGGLIANLIALCYVGYFAIPNYMAIGASGAVLAILGAALAFFRFVSQRDIEKQKIMAAKQMLSRMLVILLLQIIADMFSAQSSFIHHITGLITGFICTHILLTDQYSDHSAK